MLQRLASLLIALAIGLVSIFASIPAQAQAPYPNHEGQFPYKATMDWLVDAIPDTSARAKIFGETARALYFNGE